jgi:ribose transport system substrate-binding protein
MTIRNGLGIALCAAAALWISACGSGDSSSDATAGPTPAKAASGAEVAQLQSSYNFIKPFVDGAPLTGVEKLKGKRLVYVPTIAQVQKFVVIFAAMKDIASKLGMTITECDAKGTPAGANACMRAAVNQGAAGILTHAIPQKNAEGGYEAAHAAHVPVVLMDEQEPAKPAPDQAYARQDVPLWGSLIGQYVAQRSGSKANVLLLKALVDAETEVSAQNLHAACAGCTVHDVTVAQTDFPKLPAITSSELLKNPGTNWVIPQFTVMMPGTISGLKSSGKANDVQGAVSDGGILAMKMIKQGTFMKFVAGSSSTWEAYLAMDQALRLMTGTAPLRGEKSKLKSRSFTAENLKSLDLTGAEANDLGLYVKDPSELTGLFYKNWGVTS